MNIRKFFELNGVDKLRKALIISYMFGALACNPPTQVCPAGFDEQMPIDDETKTVLALAKEFHEFNGQLYSLFPYVGTVRAGTCIGYSYFIRLTELPENYKISRGWIIYQSQVWKTGESNSRRAISFKSTGNLPGDHETELIGVIEVIHESGEKYYFKATGAEHVGPS